MKNGFTLIELLAVIVILAIIALIAVPIVLNIINESKESSLLRSAEFYLDAAEYTIADAFLYHGGLSDGPYPITKDGDICKVDLDNEGNCPKTGNVSNTLKVEVNGEKPTGGTITINSGNISGVELILDEKPIVKNSLNELVYQESILCTANTSQATAFVYDVEGDRDPWYEDSYTQDAPVGLLASKDGAYTAGVAYTCNFIDDSEDNNMTFFVLSSTEETVTLIAGFNLKALTGEEHTVAWSTDRNNHKDETEDKQAVTAKAALAERTANWSSANGGKLSEEQMSTIKLPTAYQIAEAGGQTFNDESIVGLPTWLNSYTKTPVSYGYWTSTPNAEDYTNAWFVYPIGYVYSSDHVSNDGVGDGSDFGVRPVITISKSVIE